jgi:spore germination cell wall hydrolase CwlJ-like protein
LQDLSAQFEESMSRLFQAAAAAAIGLTAVTAVAMTAPGFAEEASSGEVVYESAPVVQAIAAPVEAQDSLSLPADDADTVDAIDERAHSSLTSLVSSVRYEEPESDELRCLATGIYFESRSEPHEGQLAVAHVILNRARSGRFASSNCGVLTQRGQFSFVRGGVVPTPPQNGQWRTAVAIARIATEGDWRNPAPGAMFFHASRVSPGWSRPRIARLGNHVFYR